MNPEPKSAAPFLEIRGVSKDYEATHALRSVDFEVESGEVHALVGENGAGKSTLVKVVTGAVQADAGRILLEGIPTLIASPLASQRLGIRVVHQHVSLVPHLTVSENMLLGEMPTRAFGWYIDWRDGSCPRERHTPRSGLQRHRCATACFPP